MHLKIYPKTWEDLHRSKHEVKLGEVTSLLGSAEALSDRYRAFYQEAHRDLFMMTVKQVWLEQQFCLGDTRRTKRFGNGQGLDAIFGHFMLKVVGISQKPVTANHVFTATSSYLKDFFPDFLKNDPFKEPEKYAYPYKFVTLDHLVFVQYVHDRLPILKYADEQEMNIADFHSWVVNHVLSYNEDVGEEIYQIGSRKYMWPYVKLKTRMPKAERDKLFDFEL